MPDEPERSYLDGLGERRDELESRFEAVTDPVSIALGAVVNPVSTVLRATIGLPVGIQTHHCLGLHIETYFAPPPALVPFSAPALFVGFADVDVIGIAIDLAVWAFGSSPVPVTGEYVGMFKALRAGDSASGIHVPIVPGILKPTAILSGEVDLLMGSDSVDAGGSHIVRFLEMGFGCNEIVCGAFSVSLPNTYLVNPIQYTFPVLAGGNSVLDVGAAIDALLSSLLEGLFGAVFGALGGPDGPVADFVREFAAKLATNVVLDLSDGEVTAESLRDDFTSALQDTIVDRGRQRGASSGHTASIDPRSARSQSGGEASVA